MAKKKTEETGPAKGVGRTRDGHPTLDGFLWHTPKMGSPTECESPGCDKVLGAWRDHDPLEAILADAEAEAGPDEAQAA